MTRAGHGHAWSILCDLYHVLWAWDGDRLGRAISDFDSLQRIWVGPGITSLCAKVFFRGITVNAVRGFPMSAAMFLGYELSLQALRGDHAVTSP
jgi:hypothetical protein